MRLFIIHVVSMMRKQTESSEMLSITIYVFITQFINTGLLLPFANADLAYQFDPNRPHRQSSHQFVRGDDPDFNSRWYKSVGQTMLSTMIVNILAPLIELMIGFLFRSLKMAIDGGICRKVSTTR